MSTPHFPPAPNISVPPRPESLDGNQGQRISLAEQLEVMAVEHPVDDLGGRPPLLEMPHTLVFFETPEEKFEARLSICNTSKTRVTYTISSSSNVFSQVPSCGTLQPQETVVVSCVTPRDSHDYGLSLFNLSRYYCVQVMEYPLNGSPMLSAIRTYWAKSVGKDNVQVTWISKFAFFKTPEGFEPQAQEVMDAFQPGGSGDRRVSDGDVESETEDLNPVEVTPDWLDMEENWEYLGVGLRPYSKVLMEGAEKLDKVEMDKVEDPSYFVGIPDYFVKSFGFPSLALGVAGASFWIGKLIWTFLTKAAGMDTK